MNNMLDKYLFLRGITEYGLWLAIDKFNNIEYPHIFFDKPELSNEFGGNIYLSKGYKLPVLGTKLYIGTAKLLNIHSKNPIKLFITVNNKDKAVTTFHIMKRGEGFIMYRGASFVEQPQSNYLFLDEIKDVSFHHKLTSIYLYTMNDKSQKVYL